MDDLESGTSTVAGTGNPSGESVSGANGTSAAGGEATQGATAQDTFVPEGVDVNTLPPNVRAIVDKINKDMVRGFTEKTTKLSETTKSEVAKATAAFKQKADFYDQFSGQKEFVEKWNQYVQQVNAQSNGQGDANPELAQLKAQVNEVNQKLMISELSQVTEAFAEAVNEKGEKINPDFDKFNGMTLGSIDQGNGPEEFSLLRACIELSGGKTPQEKLANGYKNAKAFYDSVFQEGRKSGMGKLQSKVLNGTQPPSNTGTSNLSLTEKKPKSAQEALEMARKGIMVSR